MRGILNLHVLAILLFLCFSTVVEAQNTTITPEKRKVIAEIISITKADQRVSEVMQAMFKQMNATYPLIIKNNLSKDSNLTPTQKAKLESDLIANRKNFEERFQQKVIESINFQEFIEMTFYPLYDKNFTEAELNDLLAFYKTPTGQKLNEVLPTLTADSVRLSAEYLVPKIDRIVDEIMKEQMPRKEIVVSTAPPKRKRN